MVAALKVGALAKRAGVSIRALHHYDDIGLLSPSHQTNGGHRLYGAADVARLQRIRSLRDLGFSLSEIRECMERPQYSLRRVIALQVERLKEQMDRQRDLLEQLEAVAAYLDNAPQAPVDDLLRVMESMTATEKYFTREQRTSIRERGRKLGSKRVQASQAKWTALIDEVRAAKASGESPRSTHVGRLANRWKRLIRDFTGGDPGIARGLRAQWEGETTIHGLDTRAMRELAGWLFETQMPQTRADRTERRS
jgi:DNA-binding transcriptional MerR regulator